MIFNNDALELFDYNGYKVCQTKRVVEITHSNKEYYSIVFLGFVLVIVSFLLMILSWILGILALIASIVLTLKTGNNSRGRSYFKLNLQEKWFVTIDGKWGKFSRYFDEVDELGYSSEFVSEYASANKSTSQEYRVDIHIRLTSGHKIDLFRFQTETLEPPNSVEGIIEALKSTFKG